MEESKYSWDQQLDEIHISFKLTDTESPVNIKFTIINRKIKVVYNDTTIIEGTLLKKIVAGSEYWTRNDDIIDLYFNKKTSEWWESLLEGSEKVDVSKLAENSNQDFGMLDPQAQEMIEKMMYENRNKESSQSMDMGESAVEEVDESDEHNKSIEEVVEEENKIEEVKDEENKIEEVKEEKDFVEDTKN
ncbi:nuclear movement protein [Vairimorpha apis BRL 01]|uniref:Nuclear movement protein n=1 Tax=Vairimorpha apis BRL 01 TaxID=1037528 RepID=T0L872_9MICR|nr:nuclear movement protein [Vairimorpha apis BRL 01]